MHAARFQASKQASVRPGDVTFPESSSTTRALSRFSRAYPSRKSDFVPAFLHTPAPLTSRASRWRPQPARAAIETPGTYLDRPRRPEAGTDLGRPLRPEPPPVRPGRTSDGRPTPEPPPGRRGRTSDG